ncbi:MAG: nifS [Haloplasmataceae bacterium]|jgi:cysteine desulfurase|nr:nifS [Haloplasmataceae bacterium]
MYFDYASTTQLKEEVYKSMLPYLLNHYENPSSLYDNAIHNKKVINSCRKKVAELLNASANEIYFTSGGSEANNWALKGITFKSNKKEIITTRIEHHSVSHACAFLERMGYIVRYLDVDKCGFIDINQLINFINDNTIMVSVIYANNEIGTIQNIKEISKICRQKKVLLHTDAVQAVSHMQIDLKELDVDLLTISAHKFNGPKGVGLLYIKNGVEIENLIHGGSQENGKRSGTESVANIVGLTKALELSRVNLEEKNDHERSLATLLYNKLKNSIPSLKLNGPDIGKNRLPGNLNFSFKDLDGSLMCYLLNKKGICVSTGSACNSGSIEPSHVIKAIGVSDNYINGTLRITLGNETTEAEINILCEEINEIVKK